MKIVFTTNLGHSYEFEGDDRQEIMEKFLASMDVKMVVMDDEGNELDENNFPI